VNVTGAVQLLNAVKLSGTTTKFPVDPWDVPVGQFTENEGGGGTAVMLTATGSETVSPPPVPVIVSVPVTPAEADTEPVYPVAEPVTEQVAGDGTLQE
jgi:hypothetical protein